MSAATIPLPQNASERATRRRREWTPSNRERLAYRWHKHHGLTQEEVADRLGVHQTTISRLVRRLESWEARQRQSPEGRLKLQHARRWSTMDLNDELLRWCFRQAEELQYGKDYSTSRIHKPAGDPSAPMDVLTENGVREYHSVIVRFLRLAFQVNVQQLRISEMEPLPDLPEPTDEELDAEMADSEALEAEIAAHERKLRQRSGRWGGAPEGDLPDRPVCSSPPNAPCAAPPVTADDLRVTSASDNAVATQPDCGSRCEPQPPLQASGDACSTDGTRSVPATNQATKPLNVHKTHDASYVPSHVLSRMKLPYLTQRDLEKMFPSTPEKPRAKPANSA